MAYLISEQFTRWEAECAGRFKRLKANEEELNRIFIDIYGLQDELTPEVEDKDVTVRKADLQRDIKSLVSYAVGCLFGRYSIDRPGLILAGQGTSFQDYVKVLTGDPEAKVVYGSGDKTLPLNCQQDFENAKKKLGLPFFPIYQDKNGQSWHLLADFDNVIPVTDDEYFTDDMVASFVEFIKLVYGEATLEANLDFIAGALGGKGMARDVIRNYFLNDFFADHCRMYQKRPIYWLFDSGKKNGFKCLVYLHRYEKDTIACVRTDYVHEQQDRYRAQLKDIDESMSHADARETAKLGKRQKKFQDQLSELQEYEEKIHHLADQFITIDLDDGVKHNYALFEDVLAKRS